MIHVHTTASDGSADSRSIASRAARAGLSVVVVTDHNLRAQGAGRLGPVLLLSGQETNLAEGHLLSLTPGEHPAEGATAAEAVPQISSQKGFAALAHPLDPAMELSPRSRSFACRDFSFMAYPGIELWNAMSAFKRGLDSVPKGLARLFFPKTFLPGPHPRVLDLWDAVGQRRAMTGLGGADAHAFGSKRRWLPLKVYSYRRHCRLLLTGLFLEKPLGRDLATDQSAVIEALNLGRCFAVLGKWRGFSCLLETPGQGSLPPGSETGFAPGMALKARLPGFGKAFLLKDGQVVAQGRGRNFSWPLDSPGVWRLEARRLRLPTGWRPWIYCNPFYLR